MNPLNTIKGTIGAGFVLAIVIAVVAGLATDGISFNAQSLIIWLHVLAGITWIGLLYYFNFVQMPALGAAAKDQGGPGGAGISKYVAPRALLWFRWAAVVTWLVLLRRFPIRRMSVWLLLPVILLMFLSGVVLYTTAAPVQPALQSYWLAIHVFAIALGSGMVLVPGVVSVLYLIKVRRPGWATRLPAADVLDQVAYRTTVFAFPIYTAGVIFGAIWAESAWGRFWGWDPKETVAFIAWIVYAAYLHSRATAGWRGGRAAVINVVGLAVMVFNLFFINLVVAGLHSYAGV